MREPRSQKHLCRGSNHFLNYFFRPPLVTDRRPTVSWSWQEKVSTTDETSTSLSNFYFPNEDEIINDFDDYASSTTVNRPTRPTRPPKPSTMDLVTYFPPLKNNNKNKPIPTLPPTTSTTRRTTTTTRVSEKMCCKQLGYLFSQSCNYSQ